MRTIRVHFDARRDLFEAGLCYCERCVRQFREAWLSAADSVAREHGIAIDVVEPGDPDWPIETIESDDYENSVWQEIHDTTVWDNGDGCGQACDCFAGGSCV